MRWSNNGEKLGILYNTYTKAGYKEKDRKLFIYDLVKDSETLIENIPADSFDFFWVD